MVFVGIKTPTGKTITVNIKASDTIATLKAKIQEKEGTPLFDQQLTLAGAVLENNSSVCEYVHKPLFVMTSAEVVGSHWGPADLYSPRGARATWCLALGGLPGPFLISCLFF